ncbi:MAG: stage III sporulation protein AB [Oscillospiraceae bacterium]|nr:stage III sporulation protein AB [Oscillospiraceae bacterium]
MRIVLALSAFFICAFIGFNKSRELKKRAEFLDEISVMLNNFSAEISFGTPELSELVDRENGGFARLVNKNFAELSDIKAAWEKACDELPKKAEETALLRELLPAISKSGSNGAVMALSLYSERFSRLYKQAYDEYTQKGGAFKQIGALCGAAAAILIM